MKYRTLKLFVAFLLIFSFSPLKAAAILVPGALNIQELPPVPIADSGTRNKEVGLTIFGVTVPGLTWDAIAINIVKPTIERIVDSTVQWINTGFDGNPAFVNDPASYFQNIADGVAGNFIAGSDLGLLCSPFQAHVKLSLTRTFKKTPSFQCTITDIVGNLENFYSSFSAGGWESWFSMTQNPNNNPYGSYIQAQIELDRRIAAAIGIEEKKLDWGSGFLSYSECEEWSTPTDYEYDTGNFEERTCLKRGPIKTPGKVIEGQLQNVLGTGISQLELADEFDELVGALMSQLLQKTVFSAKGLASDHRVSGGSSGGGGGSDTQLVACFANKQNASIGDSITWSAQSALGTTTSYAWSGNEIDGKTGQSITVTYTTPDTKRASVTATATLDNGQPRSITVVCSNSVQISKYQPLVAECRPTSVLTAQIGRQSEAIWHEDEGAIASWTVTISGGSGQIDRVIWKPASINTHMFPETDRWLIRPPVITRNATTTTYTQPLLYASTGNKTANVTVIDADPSVLPITEKMCGGSIYVYR